MKELAILDPYDATVEQCRREMRVYLVKSESEFSTLAFRKYTSDLEHQNTRNSQSGSQEKNNSGCKTKEATNSDGKATRGGGRGSRASRGSRGRG